MSEKRRLIDRRRFLFTASSMILGTSVWAGTTRNPTTYTVRRGDTLSEIAHAYGVTVSELKRANGLKGDLIRIGQKLQIPGKGADDGLADVRKVSNGLRIDRSRWKYIVGHHSAIASGNAEIYDRNHRRRGMTHGLAYHFVIGNGVDSGDGEIEIGPRWREQQDGGHVRSHEYNAHGIGICVVGNFEKTRPSPKQIAAFSSLVSYLGQDLLGSRYQFTVHREIKGAQTLCPGKYFPVAQMHRRFG